MMDDAPPPGILRLTAPNPSPLTATGTQTYLLGGDCIVVIDPGPDDPGHLAAILAALGGRKVSHVVVTHPHRDHSALAPRLARLTGATLAGFGPHESGRSPAMQALAAAGLAPGPEEDRGFVPDLRLGEGDEITTDLGPLRILHLPGHHSAHIGLERDGVLFSGDQVMGWSSSVVIAPAGDMDQHRATLARLAARDWRLILPGHGPAIAAPAARLTALRDGIESRAERVAAALRAAPGATLSTITGLAYPDVAPALFPAAQLNCHAHLAALCAAGRACAGGPPLPGARYWPAG